MFHGVQKVEEEKDFSKEMTGESRPQRDSILFNIACSSFYFVMASQLSLKKKKKNWHSRSMQLP